MEGIALKNINIQRVRNPLVVEPDEVIVVQCTNNETLLDLRNQYYPDVPCVVVRILKSLLMTGSVYASPLPTIKS